MFRKLRSTKVERCFWYTKDNFNAPGRETFCHVFFEYPTSALILTFRTKYLMGIPEVELKPLIIAGIDNEGKIDSISQIESILLLFCIWEGKLRKRALSYYTVETNMFFYFNNITCNSSWVKALATIIDNVWCRHWRGRAGSRCG